MKHDYWNDPRAGIVVRALCEEMNRNRFAWDGRNANVDAFYTLGREVLEALDLYGWLPIDSAPKDGTEILGFDGSHIIASWVDNSWWSDVGATFQPTHWQPLTSPPTQI